MPAFEDKDNEFKFPDEVELKDDEQGTPEIEIEVEDDTPEEDRGREPMPKPIVEELEKDDLTKYDEQTKERIKQLRKVWHDERRAKESAYREQQEAIAFAQRIAEENKRIKSILTTGEKEYVESMQTAANYELELAKRSYKEAYDNGDTDKLIEAQQAMQNANIKLAQIKNFKLPSLQDENYEVQRQQEQVQQPSAPAQDPRLSKWTNANEWFGSDEEMTATALGIHNKLERSGYTVGSEEYYAELDKTIRKRYPEYFEDSVPSEPKGKSEAAQPKLGTVVAPATRSTSSNKIKLKQSQIALAKKLGLTPEQYAIELKRLEQR